MPQTLVTRRIEAPPERVFRAVAHVEEFSKAVPHVVRVEFLTPVRTGLGTRFRETRLMRGKESSVELEVTEYAPPERVRLVSDTHGTIWDTVFTVRPEGAGSVLTMTMDANARGVVRRVMVFLIGGMVRRAIETDMDAVKAYCEG